MHTNNMGFLESGPSDAHQNYIFLIYCQFDWSCSIIFKEKKIVTFVESWAMERFIYMLDKSANQIVIDE